MKKFLPPSFGFTLIELLVVIAIIVVLALMGFAAFGGLTGKGNDARRLADIKAIADALEVKRATATGSAVYVPIDTTSFSGGTIPKEPTSRTVKYCYKDSDLAAISNPGGWSSTVCFDTTTWTSLDGLTSITPRDCAGGIGSTTGCKATYFKVCTMNESLGSPICYGSRQ